VGKAVADSVRAIGDLRVRRERRVETCSTVRAVLSLRRRKVPSGVLGDRVLRVVDSARIGVLVDADAPPAIAGVPW
jgi:hypothetical protein